MTQPWTDAPLSRCCRSPLTPLAARDHDSFPADGDVRVLVCLGCGAVERCRNVRRIAQAWWAAGAWEGRQHGVD